MNIEAEDGGDGYYDGSVYIYNCVEDTTPFATGTFRVNASDYRVMEVETPETGVVEAKALMYENLLKLYIGASTYLYRRSD